MNLALYDEAMKDFEQVVTLEPYDMDAIYSKIIARIRKYKLLKKTKLEDELRQQHKKIKDIVVAESDIDMPQEEKDRACNDFQQIINYTKLDHCQPPRLFNTIDYLKNYISDEVYRYCH